jgi:hypothetical protein
LIFQDKKFYLITKNDDAKQYNNLYYYCNNHRTTKLSDQVDKNGNKTRINICDSKIKYEKVLTDIFFLRIIQINVMN